MNGGERSTVGLIPRDQVERNKWGLLVPDRDATWTPHRTVSVCIPARDPGDRLERLLLALSLQTYPHDLIEVIVTDDTSKTPITVDSELTPFEVQVIRQDAAGFAAGRARHRAATAASGEVLVFLDADMVPSRHVLDAYLRWFERNDAVVPFGFTAFVDWPAMDIETVVEALRRDDDALLDGAGPLDSQNWREPTFELTNDLQIETADMFRTLVGATLAVSARQYEESGGFSDLGVRGVEDIEFGYRLQNNGAILIADRSARHWHPGGRTMSGERVAEIRRRREPFTRALLPVGGFRPDRFDGATPINAVPQLLVHVPEELTGVAMATYLEGIDRSGGIDVAVRSGVLDGEFRSAFAQAVVFKGISWGDGAPQAILDELLRRDVGTLLVVSERGALVVEVVRTRALRSVRRLDAVGRRDIRRLFGVAVVEAASVRLIDSGITEANADDAGSDGNGITGSAASIRRLGKELKAAWSARRPR